MSNGQKVKVTVVLWAAVFLCAFALRLGFGAGDLRQSLARGVMFAIALLLAGAIAIQARTYALTLPERGVLRIVGQIPLGITLATFALGLLLMLRAMLQASEGLN